jgi:hypothetical protein
MNTRVAATAGVLTALFLASSISAHATGTVSVRQANGSVKTYKNVKIRMNGSNLAVTSADGKGVLVVGKDACTRSGATTQCLPYDAVLTQYDELYHVPIVSGTLSVNQSSRSVTMKFKTKAHTQVSLTGTIDEMQK